MSNSFNRKSNYLNNLNHKLKTVSKIFQSTTTT